jgi:hypothetical protein
MSDEGMDPHLPHTQVSVVVTKMPEAPTKPLLHDSTRLLSLAAFVFSVATGVFATYQTWKSSRESTIENVSKLIDQYYTGQEKLATLDVSTQLAYVNLLRSKLRGTASRTVVEATSVRDSIDDGTWLALAQINDNENNLDAAEMSWSTAANNTQDIAVYLFAMRGLASTQLRRGKKAEAQVTIKLALDAASDNAVKGSNKNPMPDHYRRVEAAAVHAYWLTQIQTNECSTFVPHYDAALASIAEASNIRQPYDFAFQNQLLFVRSTLSYLRTARAACPPSNVAAESEEACNLVANILDNAQTGFAAYKGPADGSGFRSRLGFPDAEVCKIDSRFTFYCIFPERNQAGTEARHDKVVKFLSACKNLGVSIVGDEARETTRRSIRRTNIKSLDRPDSHVDVSFWNPGEGSPTGRWETTFEVEPPRQ